MKRFYKNTFKKIAIAGGLTFAIAFDAASQPELVKFTFTGATGFEVTHAPDYQPTNAIVSDISRGPGVTIPGSNPGTNIFVALSWPWAPAPPAPDLPSAPLDADSYFSFSISPNAGYEIDLDSLIFSERRSGTGPRTWAVRSSVDGFTTDIATQDVPDDTNTRNHSFGLNASYEDLLTPVEFRFYGFNAEADGGTWRLDNISLKGSVNSLGGATTIAFTGNGLTIDESAGNANVLLSIANPSATDSSYVDVVVTGGTADAGTDFTYTTTMVVFPAGSSANQTISINIIDDAAIESAETIILSLQNPSTGVQLGNSTFTITITDNDTPIPAIPLYTIASVTTNDAAGVADSLGVEMKLRGITHGINNRTSGYQFTLIDNTGGVGIFKTNDIAGYTYSEGDSLEVTGTLTQFRGLTQLEIDSVHVFSTGNPLFGPATVTVLDESTESEIIRLANPVTIVTPSQWTGTGSGFSVDVTDGTNTYVMRITPATDMFSQPVPTGEFYLTGIGGQFKFDAPFTSGYQIAPRYMTDLDFVSSRANTLIGNLSLYPNPASSHVMVNPGTDITSATHIQLFNSLGQLVSTSTVAAGTSAARVEMGNLPAGHYIVKMSNDNAVKTGTVVKF